MDTSEAAKHFLMAPMMTSEQFRKWADQLQATSWQAKLNIDHNPSVWLDDAMEIYSKDKFPAPELTSQMFEDAIEHINTHGWGQGEDVNETGAVCTRGALLQAELGQKCSQAGAAAFWARHIEIAELMGIPAGIDVTVWNDHPDRTREHVIDALMSAAKKLREQGR